MIRHAKKISIHALLAESDPPAPLTLPPSANFYPRSPCGERPPRICLFSPSHRISIHALLAESDLADLQIWVALDISIHALLAESDNAVHKIVTDIRISIHALLAESDSAC